MVVKGYNQNYFFYQKFLWDNGNLIRMLEINHKKGFSTGDGYNIISNTDYNRIM